MSADLVDIEQSMSIKTQTSSHPIHRFIRYLTVLWIVTVTLYALLALSSNILLNTALTAHDVDTSRVNALGLLRTFSQTIALDSIRLAYTDSPAEREIVRNNLLTCVGDMRLHLQGLLADEQIIADLANFFSDDARDLNTRLTLYLLEAQQLAESPDDLLNATNASLRYIEANATILLDDLDAQVNYYQTITVENLVGLSRVNFVRMAIILGLLAFQSVFFFTPVRTRLRVKATQLITEISERQRIQRALEEKQHFIDQITGAIPDLVYVYDLKSGHNIYTNQSIPQKLGYSSEEATAMKGKVMVTLIHPEDRQRQLEDTKRYAVSNDGEILESEYRLKHADGNYRLMFLRVTLFKRDEQGNPAQMLGVLQDVTEQRFLVEQTIKLNVQNELEKERARLLGEFITHTSHDIRTPLSIINTSMYMLKRHTDPERQQHYITEITNAVTRLTHIIDQMHQMAQLEQLENVATQKINLRELIKDVQARQQAKFDEKQLSLILNCTEPVCVEGDYQWMYRAIEGIVDNAIRHTPDHGEIAVSVFCSDGKAVVKIEDSGKGIDADALPHIFERFYKLDSARTGNGSGAGMGLSIAKRVIELYGGKISAESTPDTGMTFTITLPSAEIAQVDAIIT